MVTHIISCHVNASFLKLQYLSLQKYFEGGFHFHVFDDSRATAHPCSYNELHTKQIQAICDKYNIQYHRIPPDIHTHRNTIFLECGPTKSDHPVARCAAATQYAFNTIVSSEQNGYCMILDSDMFLIQPLCLEQKMAGRHILGVPQSRGGISYLWNGLFACNLNKCLHLETFNWEASRVYILDECGNKTTHFKGCDVGGHNYYYLARNGYFKHNRKYLLTTSAHMVGKMSTLADHSAIPAPCRKLLQEFADMPSPPSPSHQYVNKEFLLDYCILHIRGGGGWCYHKKAYHEECVRIISKFINV